MIEDKTVNAISTNLDKVKVWVALPSGFLNWLIRQLIS